MFESEVRGPRRRGGSLSPEVRERFVEVTSRIEARTTLPWGEHCTECAVPDCFRSCHLYVPRDDGKCRRFRDGMERIPVPGSVNGYVTRIRFERWALLHTPGNLHVMPAREAANSERRDALAGHVLRLVEPASVRRRLVRRRGRRKIAGARTRPASSIAPTHFLLEVFNPADHDVVVILSIRNRANAGSVFETHVTLPAGFTRTEIAIDELRAHVSLDAPFDLNVMPHVSDGGTTLVFGAADFVRLTPRPGTVTKRKCLVWDLDDTLWSGTLVEDGVEQLQLRTGALETIRELDRRGILLSVASKNDRADAIDSLRRFGIDDFFLAPQASWGPKSDMLSAIATELNIGVDSIAFIDDSAFEREEVSRAHPSVLCLDAAQFDSLVELTERPELDVPVTAESTHRRRRYREQAVRTSAARGFGRDYLAFLRECRLVLTASPLSEAALDRVAELAARTNQMNFSGTRYSRADLDRLRTDDRFDTYVLTCSDRFGDYGTVGFGVVEPVEPRVVDLTFSCRVQSKRVEHAFLTHLLTRYASESAGLAVNYRKTPRNAQTGRVFDDFGFEPGADIDGVRTMWFAGGRAIPDDGIVDVRLATSASAREAGC